MTLASSGAMTFQDLADEASTTSDITLPDALTRHLANVDSGNPVFPTDFYGNSAVRVVDSVILTANQTGFVTFSGVNFGPAFSGRRLVAVVGLHATGDVILDQTDCDIGGNAASGIDAGEHTVSNGSCGVGIWHLSAPSGTSGSVVCNWAGSTVANGARLVLLSVAGITSLHDSYFSNGGGSGGTSDSGSIDTASPGIVISAVVRESTSNITLNVSGSPMAHTTQTNFDSTARMVVGWNTRMSTIASRSTSWSASGNAPFGFVTRSFTN